MIKNKQEADEKLGRFYLQRSDNNMGGAVAALSALRITCTSFRYGYGGSVSKYVIRLYRPGLLIGVKGENIMALQKYMGCDIRIEEEMLPDPYYHILRF